MKRFFYLIAVLAMVSNSSCVGESSPEKSIKVVAADSPKLEGVSKEWLSKYDLVEAKDLPDNMIDLVSSEWFLVTAGKPEAFNTMLISWGTMGYLWARPVSTIFIRGSRYTFGYLESNDSYTLSVLPSDMREELMIFGTKSGRDTDKVAESGLSPITTPSGLVSYSEARMIIECKKIYVEEFDFKHLTEEFKELIPKNYYTKESSIHYQYISEITNIWLKR